MSEGSSQWDSLLDPAGTWSINFMDATLWYAPALLLTVPFFAALALLRE